MTAVQPRSADARTAHVEVLEQGGRRRHPDATPCVIARDLIIEPDALAAYRLRHLPPRADDLLLAAGAVSYADRVVRRRLTTGWERRIHLSLPVREPDFWEQRRVGDALSRVLHVLTGDHWTFDFAKRRTALGDDRQTALPFGERPRFVMPYSDGLDSLAVARLTARAHPGAGLILVTVGKLRDPDADWRLRHFRDRYHRVRLPFRMVQRAGVRFREGSYRSRAFLFGVMSGAAAGLLGAERSIVSESGQGSLGPSLTRVAGEAADVRMHPAFTRALSKLLALVFERAIPFDHPQLWATKGETLSALMEAGLADDWHRTRSCARDARHIAVEGRRAQCGVCANCLLRRQSLMTAGLDEARDRYLWPRLGAESLRSACADAARPASRNDDDHALSGVLAMAELASLGRPGRNRQSLEWEAADLALVLGEPLPVASERLSRLLAAHRAEWDAFVSAQGPESFVGRFAALATP